MGLYTVQTIEILENGEIRSNGRWLHWEERERLARAEGFAGWAEMIADWRDGGRLPFEGQILFWAKGGTS